MGKHYKEDFKIMVVKEYLGGLGLVETNSKYDLKNGRVKNWVRQYRETGRCEDKSGKSLKKGKGSGRPKKVKTDEMTNLEYIRYLEMENEILKKLCSLNNKEQK